MPEVRRAPTLESFCWDGADIDPKSNGIWPPRPRVIVRDVGSLRCASGSIAEAVAELALAAMGEEDEEPKYKRLAQRRMPATAELGAPRSGRVRTSALAPRHGRMLSRMPSVPRGADARMRARACARLHAPIRRHMR